MSAPTRLRVHATILFVAPVLLLGALSYHPYVAGPLPNHAAIGAAVAADTTRWAVAHLAAAGASGILVLAFLSVRSRLREAGEDRWSLLGVPFIVLGSTLFAVLPGMEFAPLAAARTGADPAVAQGALDPWFWPVLLTSAVTFALGSIGFAIGIVHMPLSSRGTALIVAASLLVVAASRFVPLAAVQFYVQGTAAIVAFWPLAHLTWKEAATWAEVGRGAVGPSTPTPAAAGRRGS